MPIAEELPRRGIPTPSGKLGGSAYSLRNILKNRTCAGIIQVLKTKAIEPKIRKGITYGKSGRRSRPEDERIRLECLVESAVAIEQEFEWMQQRL